MENYQLKKAKAITWTLFPKKNLPDDNLLKACATYKPILPKFTAFILSEKFWQFTESFSGKPIHGMLY